MPGKYPFPSDCEVCDEKNPCEDHKHLAEPDPMRTAKGE